MAAYEFTSSARSTEDDVSRPFPDLPFITVAGGPNRAVCDYFDVPAEDYGEGNQTGIKAAWQFMQALAQQPEDDVLEEFLPSILESVISAQEQTATYSQQGAAVGFMTALSKMLAFAAKNSSWAAEMDKVLHLEERCALTRFQEGTEANNDFRVSMGFSGQPAPVVESTLSGAARAVAKGRSAEIAAAAQARKTKAPRRKAATLPVVS